MKVLAFINNFLKLTTNFIIKLMVIAIFVLGIWILFDILYLIDTEISCTKDLSKNCLIYAQNRKIMGYRD